MKKASVFVVKTFFQAFFCLLDENAVFLKSETLSERKHKRLCFLPLHFASAQATLPSG